MFAIMGASGNIGGRIAQNLLAKGEKVRVIGRNAHSLKALTDKGAEAVIGDAHDAAFLAKAFSGVKAAFVLIPPNFAAANFRKYQNELGVSIAQALKASGVKKVVNLSSLGAHLPDGTGPIAGLYDQEQRLNALEGVDVLHLRPTYFMENLLANIPLIKGNGINGSVIKADLEFEIVATQDIGDVATEALLKTEFSGKSVHFVFGPKPMSMRQITGQIGSEIGKPQLPYVEFPSADAEKAMIAAGLMPDLAHKYVEMMEAMNAGLMAQPQGAFSRGKVSVHDFAKEFARAFTA